MNAACLKIIIKKTFTLTDPDLELGGWGSGFVLLALPAFLASVISSFVTQNKGEPGPPWIRHCL